MKRHLIIAVIVTFCLAATLFTITSTTSTPGSEYDPWLDFNDDGKIDLKDYFAVALAYGALGDPTKNVNVTNWPLDENGNLKVSCYESYNEPGIYKDVVKIDALEWTAIHNAGTDLGVLVWRDVVSCLLPFDFCPEKQQFLNVTDLWIVITEASDDGTTVYFDITINDNITITTSPFGHVSPWMPRMIIVHIEDVDIHQLIAPGINTIELHNVYEKDTWIYRVSVFIEYEYEI